MSNKIFILTHGPMIKVQLLKTEISVPIQRNEIYASKVGLKNIVNYLTVDLRKWANQEWIYLTKL